MAQFRKGEPSPNPKGRPRKSSTTETIRAANLEHAGELLDRLRLLGLGGDVGAARCFLDRILPPLKAVESIINLKIDSGLPLSEQSKLALDACFKGQITPSQGQSLITAIGTHSKIIESTALLERLEAVEQALKNDATKKTT